MDSGPGQSYPCLEGRTAEQRPEKRAEMDHPIILFDGVCRFCNSSVNFIIDHDPARRFRFAPLQSPLGQSLLRRFGLLHKGVYSVILVEGQRCYVKSTAALRIARGLTLPWPLLSLLVMVPPLLRDGVYDWFARNRFRWFGRLDHCRMPTPDLQQRFLDIARPEDG
jgi:predicted DCC family thiol-disulfide oxidoreductase YuxK